MNYYECEFSLTSPDKGTYSICIKGERKPTPAEAEHFCSSDMAMLNLTKCVAVDELTHDEAFMFYDMSRESEFPIFR